MAGDSMGKHTPAVLTDELDFDAKPPGQFKYWRRGDSPSGQADGLHFWCPCGCGSLLGASFEPGRWTWDGNREKPTVNPSILHMDGCRWHGFLRAGVFEEC